MTRYGSDGAPDSSFAGDGRAELQLGGIMFGSVSAGIEGLAVQSNGNITAVGGFSSTVAGPTGGDSGFAVRLQSSGVSDQTFGPSGSQTIKFGTNEFANYETALTLLELGHRRPHDAGRGPFIRYGRQRALPDRGRFGRG